MCPGSVVLVIVPVDEFTSWEIGLGPYPGRPGRLISGVGPSCAAGADAPGAKN